MTTDRTTPTKETREADRAALKTQGGPDREPTAEEAKLAEGRTVDPEVAKNAKEMYEKGAQAKGEGRLP